jgi:hypothetical protein
MQRNLGDQRVIPVHLEYLCALQRPNDQRDRSQLCSALRKRVFVHRKRLDVQVLRQVFEPEATFEGDLGSKEE